MPLARNGVVNNSLMHFALIDTFVSYFSDFYVNSTGFDFQGATAYLDWDYVFPDLHFTLLHKNFRSYNIVTFYVNWGFVVPTWNFELSAFCH